MKRKIYIIGSVVLFLMSVNVYGQDYKSVLKKNMELKIEISNLKGELETKDKIIKRSKELLRRSEKRSKDLLRQSEKRSKDLLRQSEDLSRQSEDLLSVRNAEIRKLKNMLEYYGIVIEGKKVYRFLSMEKVHAVVSKILGPSNRKGVKRIWAINNFTINNLNVQREKTLIMSIDWSSNTSESMDILMREITMKLYNENARFDYLLFRYSSPIQDKYGHLFETISAPTIIRRDDLAKINWRLFKGDILTISAIDRETRNKMINVLNSEPRFKFDRIQLE